MNGEPEKASGAHTPELVVPEDWVKDVRKVTDRDGNGKEYTLEVARSGKFFALALPKKGEDCVRVVKTKDGLTVIALADGVSGTLYGKEAAQVATEVAIGVSANGGGVTVALGRAQEALNENVRIGDLQATFRQHFQDELNASQGYKRRVLQSYEGEGSFAATTLNVGKYDPQNGDFLWASTGDSPVVTCLLEGGRRKVAVKKGRGQLRHGARTGAPPAEEMRDNLVLKKGDCIFFTSDGLNEEGLGERLASAHTVDQIVEALIAHIQANRVDDDISVVGLVHD